MYLVDNFLARCEARGESPSHALEAAGLSKSFLSKFKKYPDRVPQGDSLAKLAKYFGCTIDDLPIIIPRLTELLNNLIYNNINNNSFSSQSSSPNCDKFIVEVPRDGIYKAINQACLKAGLPPVGIHGLRHSFASLAYHLGWKKMTTMQVGGWHNSKVLDAIYTHNADFDADISTMVDFFVQNNVQNTDNSC